jgi:hypothetical protein
LKKEEVADRARVLTTGGRLTAPMPPYVAELRDSRQGLASLYGRVEYPTNLPMLYSAMVRKNVLDAARSASGRFFVGSSPDVGSAAQILATAPHYLATKVPAVLIHYPSDPGHWSNGAACAEGSDAGRSFFDDFGISPLARHKLPQLVCSSIFQTLIDAAEASPRVASVGPPSWEAFVGHASREIEGRAAHERMRLHREVFASYGNRKSRARLSYLQARAAIACHLPGPLIAAWRRYASGAQHEDGEADRIMEKDVSNRDQALRLLGAALASDALV